MLSIGQTRPCTALSHETGSSMAKKHAWLRSSDITLPLSVGQYQPYYLHRDKELALVPP